MSSEVLPPKRPQIARVIGWLALGLSVGVAGYAIYDAFQPARLRPQPPPFKYYDKVLHVVAYGALATLLCQGLALFSRTRAYLRRWHGLGLVWFGVTLLGAICEVIQYAQDQGRIGDPYDVLANAVGAAMACLLFRWLQSVEYAKHAKPLGADLVALEKP